MVSELRVRTAPTSQLSPADLHELRALLDAAFAGRFSDDDWAHAVGGVHVIASVDGEVAPRVRAAGVRLPARQRRFRDAA